MMSAGANEFGTALYTLAKEESLQKQVLENLNLICNVFSENKQYLRLLQNPILQKEERLSLLDGAFKESVHKHVLNFCKILCEKSALNILPDCKKVYKELMYEENGILPVVAISAKEITKDQQSALIKKVESVTGKNVELTVQTDETLIGGIKLIYSGKEIDGSATGRLEHMQTLLLS